MNALDRLHAALRPRGVLLDVRPAPEHPWVEVAPASRWHAEGSVEGLLVPDSAGTRRAKRVVRVGQLDDSYRIGTQTMPDAALQAQTEAGRWVREREELFTFVYHFDSVRAWLDHMAMRWSTAHVSDELIARVRRWMSASADTATTGPDRGELRVARVIRASRLRRV